MRRFAVLLATGGGAGYSPVAPGTAGSAVGLIIYALSWWWAPLWQIALVAVVSVVGIWVSGVAARHFGREDPGQVVIDEIAGQLVTLLLTGAGVGAAVAGFFIFRVLDVIKPWPAGRFERLPGGLGIMADDLMAGIYGNLLLRLGILLAARVLVGAQ
jgi:phosphatidylglycerophosphatase A